MAQGNIKRKPLVVGNWKMNTTADEAIELARSITTDIGAIIETDIVICPPFVWLSPIASVITNTSIKLGAQNLHWEDKGAYTGEISARMLKDVGCEYVIIGHSERRQYFGETDQSVNQKLKKAIDAELTPIVCLGESLQDREANRTNALITNQFNNDCFIILIYRIIGNLKNNKSFYAVCGNNQCVSRQQIIHSPSGGCSACYGIGNFRIF